MRPQTYYTPGLDKKVNGSIAKILSRWNKDNKDRLRQRSSSLSANKRKKQFEDK